MAAISGAWLRKKVRHPWFALFGADFQMTDAGQRPGRDRRWQRRGEYQVRREAANEIADCRGCRDIAADDAERLRKRALDHGQAMAQSVPVGDAAAPRTIETDAMNLISIGHGVVSLGDIAELLDRRDIAVRRIDRVERDQFRHMRIEIDQSAFQIPGIVVGEDPRALPCRSVSFALQDVIVVGTGDIAGAARAGPSTVERLVQVVGINQSDA